MNFRFESGCISEMRAHNFRPATIIIVMLAVLSACATEQPAVIETLDELTAVTVTYCRTPLVMSPDTPLDREARRDYLQLGVIEVNQMGSLQYYLWLSISLVNQDSNAGKHVEGFESIVLAVNDESVALDAKGWTPGVIGISESVYQKIFPDSAEAYYPVTLEQIQILTDSDNLKLHTSGSAPGEFVSWYSQTTFESDLSEFLGAVMQ